MVLADAAERGEDIDLQRAITARERAEAALAQKQSNAETARAAIALNRAIARIRVAEISRGRTATRRQS